MQFSRWRLGTSTLPVATSPEDTHCIRSTGRQFLYNKRGRKAAHLEYPRHPFYFASSDRASTVTVTGYVGQLLEAS
jgi:hypothetical protein